MTNRTREKKRARKHIAIHREKQFRKRWVGMFPGWYDAPTPTLDRFSVFFTYCKFCQKSFMERGYRRDEDVCKKKLHELTCQEEQTPATFSLDDGEASEAFTAEKEAT